uniref:Uncharacterized protein n=1 Tax=Neogobius melanostomus TaxID=47308 RepID=A0A8C6WYQ8_9GOBI
MFDNALRSLGTKVVVASSHDENYPPENIIDGNNGETLKIERNTSEFVKDFETVIEKVRKKPTFFLFTNKILTLNGISATHLRFIIESGYDYFVSVHNVSVQT